MKKLTLNALPVKGKKVLVRVDFNVPLNKDGTISDDTRIKASLPTIQYILKEGGSAILMSHLGRPEGEKEPKYSLAPCAKRLSELLKKEVHFAPDCVGHKVEKIAKELKPGEVLLLENLRFHAAEEKPEKDPSFAKNLAKLGDVYVDDAFGTAHRAHSSTVTITNYFPKTSAAGFLLEKEIEFLGAAFSHPKHPFYAIIGGAKISTKMGVLESLLSKVDALFIGGGMAYTFFKAEEISIGDSIHEDDLLKKASAFLKKAAEKKVAVYLPTDLVIANRFDNQAESKIISINEGIPKGWQGMDIGPQTLKEWTSKIEQAKMIFWNGPLGVFEFSHFAGGTNEMAKALASLKAITIVGGGDSLAAVSHLNLLDRFTHISTGGGATLEYIEFGHLPGIDALTNI
ncbi:MAG TPA: phosphoglycerate kinase [Rhabdochlamydiaceae bacterium]|nr:phosphoglycerate kinase [Rhabdochlamydiaceae bacterium]